MRIEAKSGPARRINAGGIAVFLLMAILFFLPARASARSSAAGQVSVGVSVNFGPPPLPVYAQPMCPGPGYIWTPGYWAYDRDDGYFWVPGTWVMAPFEGALWTPGYWGWDPAAVVFAWHPGYWGLSVGFYGGINYGFGYFGEGYDGGYWRDRHFFYNRAVNRVDDDDIHYVYYRDEFHHRDWDRDRDRISYNGGRGGIDARPTRDDFEAEHERRMGPIREQDRQERFARRMPEARWSENHGRPGIAATERPERFMGHGVEHASRDGGPYRPEQTRDRGRPDGGQWHSFGQQPSGRDQRGQQGYRDTRRPDNQPQQRANSGRDQMRQQPQQQGNYRDGQQQRYQGRPDQRQQMRQQQGQDSRWRQQPQQGNSRGGQQQQQQGNWNRQQGMRPQQAPRQAPAQRQRGGSARQKAQPKNEQHKAADKQHGGRHR